LLKSEPSRFLLELPQDDLQWELRKEPASAEQRQEKGKTGIANLRGQKEDETTRQQGYLIFVQIGLCHSHILL
jgi:hypothetical protein